VEPGQDPAGAEHAAEPPGDAHPVAPDPPRPIRRPGQVDGARHEPAGDGQVGAGPEEAGVGVDDLGREDPGLDEPAGPVHVGEEQVEEAGPLAEARFERRPLRGAQQVGDRIEGPQRGVGHPTAGRAAGRLRKRALIAAQATDMVLGPQQGGPVGGEQLPFEAPPVGTGLAGGVVDIVETEHGGGRGGAGGRGHGLGHEPGLGR
jgi:hypothetical protein